MSNELNISSKKKHKIIVANWKMNGLKADINKISKTYGNKEVVRDISLSINRREVVGLLGPNGAGKTKTFYMIIGLVHQDSARVFLDDHDI